MKRAFSYRHLFYFWVVAKEGGIARGAERLGMAVQTVSAQVRALEKSLGHVLLKPSGRSVTLTDAGRAALRQADLLFELGEALPQILENTRRPTEVRLAVGIADGLPKLVVRHLMEPVLKEPTLRLVAHEDEFDDLLADLALHRLDVVLADRPAPPNPNLKLYSHKLEDTPIAWFAPASLAQQAKRDFPASLARVPLLLPTSHTAIRARLDRWFEQHGLRPRVVGEFEDSALLETFGAAGMGVFPAAESVAADVTSTHHVRRIGVVAELEEHYWAIAAEKRVVHPLVRRLLHLGT